MASAADTREPLEALLPRLFAGSARPALEALAALEAELAASVRPGIEHSVAHARLGWWRAEVERLAAGRPEHPLTRTLAAHSGTAPDWTLLNERLAAAELVLGGVVPATDAALEAFLYRLEGAPWQLRAQLLAGERSEPLAAFGAALGKGLGLVARRAQATDAAAATRAAERAAALLELAARALPRPARRAQVPGLVALALGRARLARDAAAPPAALVQLFIAWRAARRAYRE